MFDLSKILRKLGYREYLDKAFIAALSTTTINKRSCDDLKHTQHRVSSD